VRCRALLGRFLPRLGRSQRAALFLGSRKATSAPANLKTSRFSALALVRSDLWKAASGGRPQGVPTLGDFVAARDPGIDSAAFDAAYSQRIPNELY
jgi:hypothetical protein